MPADVLTIRERIMREVERRLRTMKAGSPSGDPYQVEFALVTRGGSLEAMHDSENSGCSVIDSDERKVARIQQMACQLVVVVEFVAWVSVDDESPSEVGNRYLGAVQRRMREDIHFTEPDDGARSELDRQLAHNVVEVRNQLFVDGAYDRKVTGAAFYEVSYKHGISDPRIRVGTGF